MNFSFSSKFIDKSFPEAELLINATLALMLSTSSFLRRTLHLLQMDLIWVSENKENHFWSATFRSDIAFLVLAAVTWGVVPSA